MDGWLDGWLNEVIYSAGLIRNTYPEKMISANTVMTVLRFGNCSVDFITLLLAPIHLYLQHRLLFIRTQTFISAESVRPLPCFFGNAHMDASNKGDKAICPSKEPR